MIEADRKSFIEELRSLSEPVKRKVMFCSAAVSMALVVYLWFAYFNTIVPNAGPAAALQTPSTTNASDTGGPGIFGLFADAAGSLWQATLNKIEGVASSLNNPKQYDINPR